MVCPSRFPPFLTVFSTRYVSVSSNVLVTAIGAGTAQIGVTTANGVSAYTNIRVNAVPVVEPESITINERTGPYIQINKGETFQLTATVLPENADDKSVTWESEDTDIIRVNQNGLVTSINTGFATITARTSNWLEDYIAFEVIEPENPKPQTGITVRLYPVSESMNETVYLYAWTGNGETMPCGAWPGTMVSKDAEGWWSYTFDESIQNINIIWNSGDGYQTVGITGVTSSTCYRLDESSYPFKVEVIDCDTPIDVSVESIIIKEQSPAARIVFINGNFYIQRDGKIYTIQGQEIK